MAPVPGDSPLPIGKGLFFGQAEGESTRANKGY
jgi:hypothetical protein